MSEQPKRSTFFRTWLPLLIGLASFAALFLYVKNEGQKLNTLDISHINWGLVAVVFGFRVFSYVLAGSSLRIYASHFGIKLDMVEGFGLSVSTSLANIFTPISGGVIARAAYLKARHKFPVTHFTSMLAASYIIVFFITSIVTQTLVLLYPHRLENAFWPLTGVLVLMGLGSIVVMVLPISWPFGQTRRVFRLIASVLDGWGRLRSQPSLIFKQMLIVLINQFCQGVELLLALRALGQSATFWQTMMITELTSTASIVRLTPGNIGLTELLAGVFAQIANASSVSVVSAALLIRMVGLLVILMFGPLFSYLLTRRLAGKEEEPISSGD